MKRFAFILFLIITTNILQAQSKGLSLQNVAGSEIVDAKSLALGESSVANPASPYSFLFNPANLSQLKETSLFYDRKSNNWIEDPHFDSYYYSAGIVMPTSIGNFAFVYSYHKLSYIYESDSYVNYQNSNYSLALSYSVEILHNLSAGATIRTFKLENNSNVEMNYIGKTTSDMNLFADFGLLYKINNPLISSSQTVKDRLYLGASIQNLGSDVFLKSEANFNDPNGNQSYPVNRFLRTGFSYGITVGTGLSENTLEFILSGEYKNQLNPTTYEKDNVDNFGVGFKTKFLDLISLNLGYKANNSNAYLFDRGKPYANYGFSLNLPFKYINKDWPFKLGFDYAVISLGESSVTLKAFNLTFSYDGGLF